MVEDEAYWIGRDGQLVVSKRMAKIGTILKVFFASLQVSWSARNIAKHVPFSDVLLLSDIPQEESPDSLVEGTLAKFTIPYCDYSNRTVFVLSTGTEYVDVLMMPEYDSKVNVYQHRKLKSIGCIHESRVPCSMGVVLGSIVTRNKYTGAVIGIRGDRVTVYWFHSREVNETSVQELESTGVAGVMGIGAVVGVTKKKTKDAKLRMPHFGVVMSIDATTASVCMMQHVHGVPARLLQTTSWIPCSTTYTSSGRVATTTDALCEQGATVLSKKTIECFTVESVSPPKCIVSSIAIDKTECRGISSVIPVTRTCMDSTFVLGQRLRFIGPNSQKDTQLLCLGYHSNEYIYAATVCSKVVEPPHGMPLFSTVPIHGDGIQLHSIVTSNRMYGIVMDCPASKPISILWFHTLKHTLTSRQHVSVHSAPVSNALGTVLRLGPRGLGLNTGAGVVSLQLLPYPVLCSLVVPISPVLDLDTLLSHLRI